MNFKCERSHRVTSSQGKAWLANIFGFPKNLCKSMSMAWETWLGGDEGIKFSQQFTHTNLIQ